MTTNEEITSLESELHACLDHDTPIDTVKLKRLSALREIHLSELVDTHTKRTEIMKRKTRELSAKLAGLDLMLKPDLAEKIFCEQDKYDNACVLWVQNGAVPWEESSAASIAAGILVLACSE